MKISSLIFSIGGGLIANWFLSQKNFLGAGMSITVAVFSALLIMEKTEGDTRD